MQYSLSRRNLVKTASASLVLAGFPSVHAQEAARRFEPKPDGWRTFEVTTTVQLRESKGEATLWLPIPSVETPWQRTQDSSWSGNSASARLGSDGDTGARVLIAKFDAATAQPTLVLTNVVQTQSRAVDWNDRAAPPVADPAELRRWTEPSELITTDGIVRKVAKQVVAGARSDTEKVQRI